jgi:hypothetical protein
MKGSEDSSGLLSKVQLKVAVTMVSLCKRRTQFPVPVQPPDQPPNVEGAMGVAVRVTVVPLGKLSMQLTAVLAQLKPEVELVTVPVPLPRKLTVNVGSAPPPPLPVLVKQTTFAVMEPVTTAPEEDTPDPSALVVTVAETKVPPQARPVAVSKPVEVTVNISGVFDAQATWLVIFLVTGGWT